AGERLEPDDRRGDTVDDRLEVRADLPAADRVPQVLLGPQPQLDGGSQGVVEDLGPAAAALLRPVHGDVGVAYQIFRGQLGGAVRVRDPDARPDRDLAGGGTGARH